MSAYRGKRYPLVDRYAIVFVMCYLMSNALIVWAVYTFLV